MDDQERDRWTKLVADFESSDLTQREFATGRGVSFSNLRNRLYKLRKETRPLAPEETNQPRQESTDGPRNEGSRLVPVRVARQHSDSALYPDRTCTARRAQRTTRA